MPPPPLPPNIPGPKPPVIPATPPPPSPPPFRARPAGSAPAFPKWLIWTLSVIVVAFVVFAAVRVRQLRAYMKTRQPTGQDFFTKASKQIDPDSGPASGNTTLALEMAGKVSKQMLELRNKRFEKPAEKSLLDTDDQFKTYCELRGNECVFLIHVPELRRFNADAQASMGKYAWNIAHNVITEKGAGHDGMKVAVGIMGMLFYDRILIGRYVSGQSLIIEGKLPVAGLEETKDGVGCEKVLYDWFGTNETTIAATGLTETKQAAPLTAPPEIASQSEEGFHDLVFYIKEQKQQPDGSRTLQCAGTYQGKPVSLEVVLNADWKSQASSKILPVETHAGTAMYRSTGAGSDAFVQALDEIYGTRLSPKTMKAGIQFNCISLEGDPQKLDKGEVKIKMFFEPGPQDDYAEFFTNIDLAANRLELSEKDEEYRPQIVKALRAQ